MSFSRWLPRFSLLVLAFSLVALLPSFWVPIGMPQEADAIAYRIPILKWILRHQSYPNWDWTFIDDYPLLGEFLLLPFFAIGEKMVRVVPLFFYFACGILSARIAMEIFPHKQKHLFLFCLVGTLALHPMLLQSNAVMTDSISCAFILACTYFCLRKRARTGSIFLSLGMATRYSVWGFYPAAILAGMIFFKDKKRVLLLFLLGASGAMPFMLRNFSLTGNPFFPLLNQWINGKLIFPFDSWGRGKGPVELLLFPFDLLYTNSFVKPIFDLDPTVNLPFYPYTFNTYTVGLFFQFQLVLALGFAASKGKQAIKKLRNAFENEKFQFACVFFLIHFAAWWLGSQQLRFLLPELLVASAVLLRFIGTNSILAMIVLCVAPISMATTHWHSWQLALGKISHSKDLAIVQDSLDCVNRLALQPGQVVGLRNPGLFLGYGNFDFMYLPPYPHAIETNIQPDYTLEAPEIQDAYEPWPKERPCAFRKKLAIKAAHEPEMKDHPKK